MYKNLFFFTLLYLFITIFLFEALLGLRIWVVFVYILAFLLPYFLIFSSKNLILSIKNIDFWFYWVNVIKYFLLVFSLLFAYKVDYPFTNKLLVVLFIFFVLFNIDKKINYILAFVMIIVWWVYLLDNNIAWFDFYIKNSIYFLFMWIIISLLESIKKIKITSNQKIDEVLK